MTFWSVVVGEGNVSAHKALLEAVRGIHATVESVLHEMDGSAKRVVAKGVYVGAFNYLELFIWERWRELCSVINEKSTHCFVDLDAKLQRQALRKQIVYLSKRKFSGADLKGLTHSLYDMLCALNGASQSLVSEELFRPHGSNVDEDELRDSFALISVPMKDIFKMLGEQFVKDDCSGSEVVIPLRSFRTLQRHRHSAAHDPSFSMQSLLAQNIDQDMLMFALCFDLAVSAFAAKMIQSGNQKAEHAVSVDDDVFVNWRAVIISRDSGRVSVFQFDKQVSKLSEIAAGTSRETHFEYGDLVASVDLPLSRRTKYPVTASELSESAAADFLRESYVQNGIAELLERSDLDPCPCDYSVYFDDEYNILDWRLEGPLKEV